VYNVDQVVVKFVVGCVLGLQNLKSSVRMALRRCAKYILYNIRVLTGPVLSRVCRAPTFD
jgi:hypothetical protein